MTIDKTRAIQARALGRVVPSSATTAVSCSSSGRSLCAVDSVMGSDWVSLVRAEDGEDARPIVDTRNGWQDLNKPDGLLRGSAWRSLHTDAHRGALQSRVEAWEPTNSHMFQVSVEQECHRGLSCLFGPPGQI
ncbi:unnamed protein product [Clonostachys rosea]|uniref:Uncharacterized protein n=1 Tax=Bionectria ochroleuca TaxID=29856 RepID=A0ABY6TYH2_BIOOC|nr:unnamed protein product [Clonostachys rosea]